MEAKRKGSMALVICSSFISPMAHAMKRHTPTGGVVRPITRLSTIITPKWRGSTPILFIRGSKTGVRMIQGSRGFHECPHHEQDDIYK